VAIEDIEQLVNTNIPQREVDYQRFPWRGMHIYDMSSAFCLVYYITVEGLATKCTLIVKAYLGLGSTMGS
jgi:hypothetical protein